MSTEPTPAEVKKPSPLRTVVLLVCGLVGMVVGGMQMYRGIGEMMGSGLDPEVKRLLTESDTQVDDANKLLVAVEPRFQEFIKDVYTLGLDPVRQEKQELARDVSEQFGKSAGMYRTAAQELDDAAGRKEADKLKTFLTGKAQAYRLIAEACDRNREIVALVLDKSIAKLDELSPKIEALAAQRDASQKAATEASTQADETMKQLQAAKK